MRLDYLSIFPAYFDVLDISLLGKAAVNGLVEVHAHDLRDWTHDRHRTVDDTPCGGGAGSFSSALAARAACATRAASLV